MSQYHPPNRTRPARADQAPGRQVQRPVRRNGQYNEEGDDAPPAPLNTFEGYTGRLGGDGAAPPSPDQVANRLAYTAFMAADAKEEARLARQTAEREREQAKYDAHKLKQRLKAEKNEIKAAARAQVAEELRVQHVRDVRVQRFSNGGDASYQPATRGGERRGSQQFGGHTQHGTHNGHPSYTATPNHGVNGAASAAAQVAPQGWESVEESSDLYTDQYDDDFEDDFSESEPMEDYEDDSHVVNGPAPAAYSPSRVTAGAGRAPQNGVSSQHTQFTPHANDRVRQHMQPVASAAPHTPVRTPPRATTHSPQPQQTYTPLARPHMQSTTYNSNNTASPATTGVRQRQQAPVRVISDTESDRDTRRDSFTSSPNTRTATRTPTTVPASTQLNRAQPPTSQQQPATRAPVTHPLHTAAVDSLRDMGFDITAEVEDLVVITNGNVDAVISMLTTQ